MTSSQREDTADGSVDGSRGPTTAEARYRAVFNHAGDAIVVVSGDGRYIDANPAATQLLGYQREELLTMSVGDLTAARPDWSEEAFRRLLATGHWEGEVELRRKDGRWVVVDAATTKVEMDGGPIYVSALRDLTDRRRFDEERTELLRVGHEAIAQAEVARQRVRLVSDASELLAVSLDYPATFVRLAERIVREIADLCFIDLLEDSGAIRRVAAVHSNPSRQALADRLGQEFPPRAKDSEPIAQTLLTGEPHLSSRLTERSLRAMTRDLEHLAIVMELGYQSSLSVPLIARARVLGVLTLVSTNPDIRYDDADVRLAEEIARRAAVRLDNARLYEERDRTAKVLQRSLLPPELPAIPHIDLAARYLPVGEGNEVGGDFYDVFDSGDGTWAAVVGDVCGKGPEAAAVMGLVRHTLRALARFRRRPSWLLEELNASLLEQSFDDRFCTVCYLRMRPGPEHVRITLCSAGHPLPLVLRSDGVLAAVGKPGQLLGAIPEISLVDSVIDLAPGDTLVLYTDGAVEQRGVDPLTGELKHVDAAAGEARLRAAVADSIGSEAEAAAARIEETLNAARGASLLIDDVALLVLRAGCTP
jgi:PAS domain S-box-containing protein